MHMDHIARTEGTLYQILRSEMRMSSSLVGRLKFQSALLVNGQPQRTNYPVRPGDQIRVLLQEPEPNYPAETGPLHILYEDEALLAVDKPPGLIVHPSTNRITGTLANFILGYYEKTGQQSAVHPATRLDRDTFGVVLLAKNSHVHALLSAQQKAGGFQKTYHALVLGKPAAQTIEAPIERIAPHSMIRHVCPEGKPARTELVPLDTGDDYSLVQLHPITGRTHQLRVHCSHAGFPILGDPQYQTPESAALSARLGLSFQQLCAAHLQIEHPLTGEMLELHTEFSLNREKFVASEAFEVYNKSE